MKKNNLIKTIACMTLLVVLSASCLDDLDRFPQNESTGNLVYESFEGYKGAIVKVYAAYALSGNEGPSGKPDISGLDEGQYADFIRMYFNHQELPTDEAHCIWQDEGIPGLNNINFSSENPFSKGLYNRCVMQIMYANEFIKNAADGTISGKGFDDSQINDIKAFRAEARFIRAFQYWVLMDIYGNPPFIDENSEFGTLPKQIKRADLFNYIESELLDLTENNLLKEARSNEYGRADKGAAWALLARMYLNAEVYTGTAKYSESATYAEKVIQAGYSLKNDYEQLFLANNDVNNPEVILSINYDGEKTRNFGGSTFLINCGSNGDYQKDYADKLHSYGIRDNANWSGYRARKEFSERFDTEDKRFLFVGEEASITNPVEYKEGLATYKWRNITLDENGNWEYGSHITYADNDFPLFRLAEMYLIYAEAVKRGGNGSPNTALGYLNQLRERAFGGASKNFGSFNDVSLNDILNERGFELYWEAHRRTDLIRYNMFAGSNYIWEWKGGMRNGRSVSPHYNIYPIPSADIMANPNLKQNPNY
ncbi:RagB/SusD family nutrient uptake outer membrane protein [Bacteroidales bacterium OttesenSCG-928-L03]|nr:RagB/SusD family nutrient uptake outer membrane protein [Bacteroidales bacterium OttesenSCG-928-L03]